MYSMCYLFSLRSRSQLHTVRFIHLNRCGESMLILNPCPRRVVQLKVRGGWGGTVLLDPHIPTLFRNWNISLMRQEERQGGLYVVFYPFPSSCCARTHIWWAKKAKCQMRCVSFSFNFNFISFEPGRTWRCVSFPVGRHQHHFTFIRLHILYFYFALAVFVLNTLYSFQCLSCRVNLFVI